jgi:hypothetical protein
MKDEGAREKFRFDLGRMGTPWVVFQRIWKLLKMLWLGRRFLESVECIEKKGLAEARNSKRYGSFASSDLMRGESEPGKSERPPFRSTQANGEQRVGLDDKLSSAAEAAARRFGFVG